MFGAILGRWKKYRNNKKFIVEANQIIAEYDLSWDYIVDMASMLEDKRRRN